MITKEQVEEAKKAAGIAYTKYKLLSDAFRAAEREYFEKSKEFQKLDYDLAMTDGRLKKVQPGESGTRRRKQPELTLDQLKAIAEKLGFDLNEVDRVDEEVEYEEEV